MYRFMFELLTDPLGLPVNDLWEYAILAVIGMIAFAFGWELSPGCMFGAIIHWSARLVAFVVLWAVAYALLAVVQWVIAHLILVCGIVAITMIVILAASATRHYLL